MTTTNTHDLIQRRAKAWHEAKDFLENRREDGVLSAEDEQIYQRMEEDIQKLTNEIERSERAERMDREMARATAQPLTGMPGMSPTDTMEEDKGRASAHYKQSFWNMMRLQGDPVALRNALSEGVDSDGGYLVPDEFEQTLITALADESTIRGLATVIQTTSGDRKIPVVASTGAASWIGEGKNFTEGNDTFDQKALNAHKLGAFIKISDELINDSAFNLEAYLAADFARRINATEEEAFVNGTGQGQPTGIFHPTEGGATANTTAKAGEITADELIDLHYALRAPYRKNATWLMNDTTVKQVRKLKDSTGQYLWQPALTVGTPDTILGRPVATSVFAPEIKAGARTVAFGDFSYYWIADRQGRAFKRLNEMFALSGQVGFLASQRVDGRLMLPEAVQVLTQKAS